MNKVLFQLFLHSSLVWDVVSVLRLSISVNLASTNTTHAFWICDWDRHFFVLQMANKLRHILKPALVF